MAHAVKQYMVQELSEEVKNSAGFIVANFSRLSVVKTDSLRRKLEKESSRLLVAKNALFKLALEQLKLNGAAKLIDGTTGIAVYKGDPVLASKVLFEFAKENENFKIRGAVVEGTLLDETQIKEFSRLPGKDVLRATVVMRMKAPITGLVNVLAGPLRGLLVVLDQISKKKAASNNA